MGARRSDLVRRPVVAAVVALAVVGSGCDPTTSHRSPDRDYPNSALGHAQLMRDFSPRIVRVVDVGGSYPDPDGSVTGAVVLIDSRLDRSQLPGDFRSRPVLVRYDGKRAARRAARRTANRSATLDFANVLYLPPGIPNHASRLYQRALTVKFQ